MCTFCKTSDFSSTTKKDSNGNKQFISWFLKPNNEGENYRVRLLFYRQSSKNDRQEPYIVQKIHDHWGTTEKGKKIVDDIVVCPGTNYVHYDEDKFVLNPRTNKKEINCPICKKAAENISAWKLSQGSDKLAMSNFFKLKAKERLCAPVYVIHDPNAVNDNGDFVNDGKFKVLILTNKDDIKLFRETVEAEKTKAYLASKEGNGYEVFNGVNAVDLYIHMDTVQEVRNQGKENESVANVRKITQIAFGKKPSNIEKINEDNINKFEFDDQFYFSNTKAEILDFYPKYYGQNDISPEEDDIFGTNEKTVAPVVKTERPVQMVNKTQEVVMESSKMAKIAEEMNELDDPMDDEPSPIEPISKPSDSSEGGDELDSILNELEV